MSADAFLDATATAELVRKGEASPEELVAQAIERIERLDPVVHAVVIPLFDKALEQARSPELPDGPFRGVPMLVKDLLCHTAGDPMYEGSAFLRRVGFVAEEDTYLAAKLRRAGFVVLGRTNTPEFGILPTTEPRAFGPSRNPFDPSRSTGGSSGGSAAAVASGMVPVAHGNDGGGSIRIPASECGLVGLKPSRGRVSLGPDHGELLGGLVCEHVLCRSVRDSAAVLDCIAGPMPGDPYAAPQPVRPYLEEVGADPGRLRVGLLTANPTGAAPVAPQCVSAAERAARLVESLGHVVEDSFPEALGEPDFVAHFMTLWAVGNAFTLDDWGRRVGETAGPDDVEPLTWALAEMGRSIPGPRYLAALSYLHGFTRRTVAWWEEGHDLLITPTIAEPPPPLGEFDSPPDNPLAGMFRAGALVPFTPPFNVTGQPAVSLPLHVDDDGLPIGVQLVAAPGREDLLFRVAAQLEQAEPWSARRPRVAP
jgi:amidase